MVEIIMIPPPITITIFNNISETNKLETGKNLDVL